MEMRNTTTMHIKQNKLEFSLLPYFCSFSWREFQFHDTAINYLVTLAL